MCGGCPAPTSAGVQIHVFSPSALRAVPWAGYQLQWDCQLQPAWPEWGTVTGRSGGGSQGGCVGVRTWAALTHSCSDPSQRGFQGQTPFHHPTVALCLTPQPARSIPGYASSPVSGSPTPPMTPSGSIPYMSSSQDIKPAFLPEFKPSTGSLHPAPPGECRLLRSGRRGLGSGSTFISVPYCICKYTRSAVSSLWKIPMCTKCCVWLLRTSELPKGHS